VFILDKTIKTLPGDDSACAVLMEAVRPIPKIHINAICFAIRLFVIDSSVPFFLCLHFRSPASLLGRFPILLSEILHAQIANVNTWTFNEFEDLIHSAITE
jgi:hypothetical protein